MGSRRVIPSISATRSVCASHGQSAEVVHLRHLGCSTRDVDLVPRQRPSNALDNTVPGPAPSCGLVGYIHGRDLDAPLALSDGRLPLQCVSPALDSGATFLPRTGALGGDS